MVILAKNARIGSEERLQHVIAELDSMYWDIVLFSETRAPSASIVVSGGHTLHTSGKNHDATGVGILIHARHSGKKVAVNISDRVMYVDVELHGKACRAIAAYLPHAGFPAMFADEVYEQLSSCCRTARICIVGGDFQTELHEPVRGAALVEFAARARLKFCNSSGEWSFRSNLGRLRLIDYILIGSRITCETSGSTDDFHLGSDHRAMFANIVFNVTENTENPERGETVNGLP